MANNYFQFKQFTIRQDKTAMKVCTDACLFAAWVAEKIENQKSKVENILDIGAGTGLLSLMLAQKNNANIDAVEIDEDAALQAIENFAASPWNDRLTLFNLSIQLFNPATFYDVIISNPPFFVESLKSDVHQKNIAKHTETLSYNHLIEQVLQQLKPQGKFYLLLPFAEFKRFETIIGDQLHLVEKADVKQTPQHNFFRTMGVFTKQSSEQLLGETITIKDVSNNYTLGFVQLLKDYYLYL